MRAYRARVGMRAILRGMTVFKVLLPANDGERYHAWDSQVGKTVPLNIGERRNACKVLAAEVADDGRSVKLTIETDEPPALAEPGLYRPEGGPGMSIGFVPIPATRAERSS